MILQAGQDRIAWWTPEVWSYLETKSKILLAQMKKNRSDTS